jgi:DNA-binding IclR family transcriptional regulator
MARKYGIWKVIPLCENLLVIPGEVHVPEVAPGSQSVDRALCILELLNDQPGLSLTEIAKRMRLSTTTAFRLIQTLQSHQLVRRDQDTRRYAIGPGMLRMAATALEGNSYVYAIQPLLEELRDISKESVALHWLAGDLRICLVELPSSHAIRMTSGIGHSYPLHAGAASKAIIAWLPAERLDELIGQFGLAGRDTRSLRDELSAIKQRGYATSFGETVPGASALAVPVFHRSLRHGEQVTGAISITGPESRWTRDAITGLAPRVVETVQSYVRHIWIGHAEAEPPSTGIGGATAE